MKFKGISLEKFVKQYLESNPQYDEQKVRENLLKSLADFKAGIKCECGQDIWVIGSSFSGNKCFRCIMGQEPSEDLELEDALPKRDSVSLDFDDFDKGKSYEEELEEERFFEEFFSGGTYHDDDGNELNPDLCPIPSMCLSCEHYENPRQKILCNLTRLDQMNEEEEFRCFAYLNKYE